LISRQSVRPVEKSDLHQIIAIENATSKSPWSLQQFEQSLEDGILLLQGDQIIGFAFVASVLDQAELHNIVIDPSYQGQGFGSVLLQSVIDGLNEDIKVLYLEVRVSNITAIRLYQQRGFRQIAERRDYYKTDYGREDALIMALQIEDDTI
jgi:ribosomal-protein-alanine N-acetyltransferase